MSKFSISLHPDTGAEINPSTKSEGWSQFQVAQNMLDMNTGIARKRTYLVKGQDVNQLKQLVADFKAGLYDHMQIQRRLSRTPFFEGQGPAINPTTNEPIIVEGAQYYQQTVLAPVAEPADIWVVNPVAVATKKVAQSNLAE